MIIDFDPAKNAKNIAERGLDFGFVADFDWCSAQIEQDDRKDYGEIRYRATGYLQGRLMVLIFKPIHGGVRVISFRKANPREVKCHAANSKN
ncbi:MAG: BrnT family toxin [Methylococcaceae bacterium]